MPITARRRLASTLLLAGSVFGLANGAMAQTAAAPASAQDAPPSSQGGLEDIVVTAQRRSENLQDVPIAIATISADDAAGRGIVTAQTLGQMVPGLQFDRVPTASTPFMRGVGTPGSTIGNEPSIAFYIDDVYVPNGSASAFEFNNVAALEVLRGPQGTLFGRNAVGGLINLRTRDPKHDPHVDFTIGYGNFDTVKSQLYATVGLSETVAVNVAAYYSHQGDGWGTNVITGNDAFKQKGYGVRAKLLFEPTDNLSFLLAGNHERAKGDIGIPGRVQKGTVTGTSLQCTPAVVGCQGAFYNPEVAGAGFYDVTGNVDNLGKRYFDSVSLKIRYEMDKATFQSISAYSYTKFWQLGQDNDNTPFALQSSHYPQFQKAFTQEFQLAAPSGSDVQWIIGAYYYHDNSVFDGLDAFRGIRVASQPAGIYGQSHTDSYSGFAQATFEMLPRTNLTIGVRYTKDKRDFETQNLFRGAFSPVFRDKQSWDAVTGRLSIDHHINDDLMIYAAYNRGFKSGVFNLAGFAPGTTTPQGPVDPEELNAYSAGFKSQFLDNRVRLNVEAFYYDYKNIQLFNVLPAGTELRNAAGAKLKGIDVDITIVPVDNLTINIGGEILDGKYTKFGGGQGFFPVAPNDPVNVPPKGCTPGIPPYPTSANNPVVQRGCDLSGYETIQTPPWSLNIAADYDIPSAIGTFTLAVAYAHRARYYFEPHSSYTSRQPPSDIINASIFWVSPSEKFDIRIWGNNLTDEKSFTYLAPSASVGMRYAPRAPRTYGITAGVHF